MVCTFFGINGMATNETFIFEPIFVFSIDLEDHLMVAPHRHLEGSILHHLYLLQCWNILLGDRSSMRTANPSQPKTQCNLPSLLDFPCVINKDMCHVSLIQKLHFDYVFCVIFKSIEHTSHYLQIRKFCSQFNAEIELQANKIRKPVQIITQLLEDTTNSQIINPVGSHPSITSVPSGKQLQLSYFVDHPTNQTNLRS